MFAANVDSRYRSSVTCSGFPTIVVVLKRVSVTGKFAVDDSLYFSFIMSFAAIAIVRSARKLQVGRRSFYRILLAVDLIAIFFLKTKIRKFKLEYFSSRRQSSNIRTYLNRDVCVCLTFLFVCCSDCEEARRDVGRSKQ